MYHATWREGVEASEFTDPGLGDTMIYGVGATYKFAPIDIVSVEGKGKGPMSFVMTGAPPNFFIDPKDGGIEGTPTEVGQFVIAIYAVNANGYRTETPLQTIQLDVRAGPNGTVLDSCT
jgi:hypothetical protein